MSIIYDALKKVEKTDTQEHQPLAQKKPKSHLKTFSLFISVAIFGILAAGILFRFFTPSLPAKAAKAPQPAKINIPVKLPSAQQATAEEKKAAVEPEKAASEMPSSLVLNGVFFSENEGYALINNQIVKQGDSIEGATLTKIGLDEVELEINGQPFKLKTR